jgi:hypothetical protein
MPRRTSLLGAAAGAAVLLAIPATASAVTGTISQPCYSHIPLKGSDPVVVALTGGTPGANYLVYATVPGKGSGSAGSVSGTFDEAGNATASITDVFPPGGSIDPIKGRAITLAVKDYGVAGDAVETPLGQTLITNIALDVKTKPRNPRSARKVTVSGTPFAGQPVYGFITKGSSNRVLRRFSLGTGDVCGYTSKKAVVAPTNYAAGTYKLYVNAGAKLNKSAAIQSGFRIYRSVL